MKFDEDFDVICDEMGGIFGPFTVKEENDVYLILKPYLEKTYNQEIEIQHYEYYDRLGYYEMREVIIDIDRLVLFLKAQQQEDLTMKLVDFKNKTINRLLFKILIKWLFTALEATYCCAYYYFDSSAYGNCIKLYFKNGG
jgi:hypothetical protein